LAERAELKVPSGRPGSEVGGIWESQFQGLVRICVRYLLSHALQAALLEKGSKRTAAKVLLKRELKDKKIKKDDDEALAGYEKVTIDTSIQLGTAPHLVPCNCIEGCD
jgi:hypothetical protein